MAVRDVVQAAAGVGGGGEYVEDVFSTYLYAGNSSTQTITNGIDLAGEGGLVWTKVRSASGYNHALFDTVNGNTKFLKSDETGGFNNTTDMITSFNSNGYSLGSDSFWYVNHSPETYASWTFRKAPKFFDVVTWTGDGVSGREIPHSLGSVPGCIIIKRTNASSVWTIFHNGLSGGITGSRLLFDTGAATVGSNITAVDDSTFTVISTGVNSTGGTYVAYLFAHDAGGFGDDGEQNVISCGSYTSNYPDEREVDLGFEPQWILVKSADATSNWIIVDNMRGIVSGGSDYYLKPNSSEAEGPFSLGGQFELTPTGFKLTGAGFNDADYPNGDTYIYIAIRRGPMKTPESGTEVFAMDTSGATAPTPPAFNSGFPVDMAFYKQTDGSSGFVSSRLTSKAWMALELTQAETGNTGFTFDFQDGWRNNTQIAAYRYSWMFRRAPGFFDVVCPNGDSSGNLSFTHNLGVSPELVILKSRTGTFSWYVYCSALSQPTKTYGILDSTFALTPTASTYFSATSTTFQTFTGGWVANNGASVAYLFASCPGVSKVGSYVGNGTTQTIDCGFSNGARFVLVKRSSNSGSWLVFDTTRGIVAGNDPYLQLNNTDAEVTNTDRLDAAASGFTVNFISGSDVDTNVNNDTYIFLAIA